MEVEQALKDSHNFLDNVFHDARLSVSTSYDETQRLVFQLIRCQQNMLTDFRLMPCFAQFIFATEALYDAYENHELTEMGNWIGWAFSEDLVDSHTKELHIGRINSFYTSVAIRSWPGFFPTMVKFFGAFFFYARERTAMNNIARDIWASAKLSFEVVMSAPSEYIDAPEIFLGVNLACWSAKEAPDLAKDFVPQLEILSENDTLPKKYRALLYGGFSTTAGNYSSITPLEWAQKALGECDDSLYDAHKLQLLSTVYAGVEDGDPSALLDQIDLVQRNMKAQLDDIAFFRDAAMRSGALLPFIVKTINAPEIELALQGLRSWYQLPSGESSISAERLYISIPFGEHGYTSVLGWEKLSIERDSQSFIVDLVQASNKFLGVAKSIAYADNSGLRIPDRIGFPMYGDATSYESAMLNGYCPGPFSFNSEPLYQLILDNECNPLQATQLKAWGKTWPITSSFSTPKPDRKPNKVLIWCGGGSLTEGLEAETIKKIFERTGATVEVVTFDEAAKRDFATAYEDDSYDVIWVASHGTYDHWSPRNVTMHVAEETTVSLADLWNKAPIRERRRLLFLNICDGARYEERGYLAKIGLAPGLACADQATISHLWPVLGYPAAAFGAYLAYYIAEGTPFFDAYKLGMLSVRKTTYEIAEDLASKIGEGFELIQHLSRKEEDYSSLEYFGSAAFYQ
ncbi:CHAT domain-containing protein [Pseudomonas syringae]|uniref:CHAT domain-containing protein n=1 Tax=Pseudomonas syringae TaxID=317 RepID=UPI0006CB1F01|nr:CHAT domain-containing protein [Pseudomonas syringae]ALE00542.1 hypothetical protein PSYRMG_13405 [Pseudomonas syringae UMAF0158]MCK9731027.1 CHAT domain-containing protein [Pseudomonas syringae pv. syringae]